VEVDSLDRKAKACAGTETHTPANLRSVSLVPGPLHPADSGSGGVGIWG